MTTYRIKAPMSSFSGWMHGVHFRAGEAVAELADEDAAWFAGKGYRLVPVASSTATAPEPTYAELKAQAKELGIPASGKKDELGAAIADERARLEAEAAAQVAAAGAQVTDAAASTAEQVSQLTENVVEHFLPGADPEAAS